MSIFVNITDLAPGQAYAFKFRSFNGDGYSDWSQIFRHRTTGDLIAPEAITGLTWDVVGGTFVGKWNKVVYDAQGKRLDDFKDYQIEVSNGTVTKTYYQLSESFTFGTDLNLQEFGAIMTTLTLTVRARDYTGNLGVLATKTATDPVPPTPSTPVTSVMMGQIVLAWDGKQVNGSVMPYNFSYVEVHVSTTNNFTPSASTLNSKQTGKFQITLDGLTYGTQYYIKLVAINELDRASAASAQATGTPARISGLDIQNGTISTTQINFADQLGGNKTWFETRFPTVAADGVQEGDSLFRTDQKNHLYVFSNGSWVNAQDASIADAATAAANAQQAANNAAQAATDANTAAATAAGIANGKGKVYIQTVAPAGDANSLWIDTTSGANTPKKWDGSAWIAVTDKAATDAATAAANAATAAGTAQTRADNAWTLANTANTTANGKNQITYGTAVPSNTTNAGTRAGDIWFIRNATTGVITAQYEWSGSAWTARTLDNAVIANLDAGKLTAGTIAADRIGANSVTADKITVAAKAPDLVVNGRFSDLDSGGMPVSWTRETGTGFAGATYATSTTAADVAIGDRSFRLNNAANNGARIYSTLIPAAAGDSLSVLAWIRGNALYTGSAVAIRVLCYDSAGVATTVPSVDAYLGQVLATHAQYGGVVVLPAGTKQVRIAVDIVSNASARNIWVSEVTAQRSVNATMIADGAITTAKINAGAVTAQSIGTNLIITSSANIGTAKIDAANIASVNAATITTGTMKSSVTASYGGVTQPVWSINVAGSAIFAEMNVIGQLVVGSSNTGLVTNNGGVSVRSYNYLAGSAGWAIKGDGSAEFNNATFRGTIASATMTSGTISGTSITSTSTITGSTITGAIISGGTITGGTVQTSASSYPRVTMDTTGINLYSAAGTIVTSLSASTGLATITGLFRSNFSGQRVEINSSWTRPEGAAPYASYAAVRIFGSDGFYGEISNGDPLNTGVYTLQMISPKATATNGAYLRLKSDDTYDMTGKTGYISASQGLTLNANAGGSTAMLVLGGWDTKLVNGGGRNIIECNPVDFNTALEAVRIQVGGYGVIAIGPLQRNVGTPGIRFTGGGGNVSINGVGGVFAVRNEYDTDAADISVRVLYTASDQKLKSNLTIPSPAGMLDEILHTTVYEYDMTSETSLSRHRGIMAAEASNPIVRTADNDIDFDAVDPYAVATTSWGAIQELYAIIVELRQEIELLKGNQ